MKANLNILTNTMPAMIDFKSSYAVACNASVAMFKQQQVYTRKSTFYNY